MPAAAASGAMVLEMLARQDFGRRHQGRLAAGLDHGGGGEQRHHGLAGADIALQQPQHALAAWRGRRRCRRRRGVCDGGERIGQGRDAASCAECPSPRCRAAGGAAQMRAHQRQRELAGQQFVIGEPRPGRRCPASTSAGSAGRCSVAQRVGEGGEAARARARPGPAIPAGPGAAASARVDRLAHLIEAQAFGQRIDRLDQRQWRGRPRRPRGRDAPSAACRRRARSCRTRSASRRPAAASPDSPCAR